MSDGSTTKTLVCGPFCEKCSREIFAKHPGICLMCKGLFSCLHTSNIDFLKSTVNHMSGLVYTYLRCTAPRAGRGYVRMGRLRWNALIWNSFLPICTNAREIAPDKFNDTQCCQRRVSLPDHMLYCQQDLPLIDHSLFQITHLPLFYQSFTTHVCQMTCLRITRVPLIFH